MQTLSVQIQDDYMQQFMNYVSDHREKITITKDENLENDLFFYERKKELQQIRDDIKSGKSQLVSFDEFENRTNQLEKELELKYANKA
jgi:hypothetical protein